MQASSTTGAVINHCIVIKHSIFDKDTSAISFRIITGYQSIITCAQNHVHATAITFIGITGIVQHKAIHHLAIVTITVNTTTPSGIIVGIDIVVRHDTILQGHPTEHAHTCPSITVGLIISIETMTNGKAIPCGSFIFHIYTVLFFR